MGKYAIPYSWLPRWSTGHHIGIDAGAGARGGGDGGGGHAGLPGDGGEGDCHMGTIIIIVTTFLTVILVITGPSHSVVPAVIQVTATMEHCNEWWNTTLCAPCIMTPWSVTWLEPAVCTGQRDLGTHTQGCHPSAPSKQFPVNSLYIVLIKLDWFSVLV